MVKYGVCVCILFCSFKVTFKMQSLHPCPTGQYITQSCRTPSASNLFLGLIL